MSQLVLIQQSIFFPFALDYGASFKKHSNEFTQREVIDLLSTREKTEPGLRACSHRGKCANEEKKTQVFSTAVCFFYHFRDETKNKKQKCQG